MHSKIDDFNQFLKRLKRLMISIGFLHLLITICNGNEVSESTSFYNFIKAVDLENVLSVGWNSLVPYHCSHRWKGVKCDLQGKAIVEIKLESLNLKGAFDADSLCRLQSLTVVSLAKNLIRGSIPESIGNCKSLRVLDLSNNLLSGRVPLSLAKLKNLNRLDLSDNHFAVGFPRLKRGLLIYSTKMSEKVMELVHLSESPQGSEDLDGDEHWYITWATCIPLVLCIGFYIVLVYFMNKKTEKVAKERKILKYFQKSAPEMPPAKIIEDVKPEEKKAELVFFVEEHESFKLEDLLEAAADLRRHTICSSLYKVTLKNNAAYAVKRLKKLQVSYEEFGQTMRMIGNLKHPNLLPLIGYNSTNEEKLLIYKYQSNGSLLNLLEGYIEGKRDFPWKLRVSIARGIARGLYFINEESEERESNPHGNLKLSNILLDANEEPLISEYGISRFQDMTGACLYSYSSHGYTAPERILSEQGDVYSFGVILLELLTSKSVEKSGIDLPKWVRAMVREEWTGEVFDREVSKSAKYAFPILNIALKCVSQSPDNRPTMAEVLDTLEEVVNSPDDSHMSQISSADSSPQDCCVLHGVIPDTWDTPGSNY